MIVIGLIVVLAVAVAFCSAVALEYRNRWRS